MLRADLAELSVELAEIERALDWHQEQIDVLLVRRDGAFAERARRQGELARCSEYTETTREKP